MKITNAVLRFAGDESGATSIEYALIGSVISIAIIVGAAALGSQLGQAFQTVADKFKK